MELLKKSAVLENINTFIVLIKKSGKNTKRLKKNIQRKRIKDFWNKCTLNLRK